MEKYYIVIDEIRQGPFTIDELKEKGITKTTLVWTENMSNWDEAKNVETLKEFIKSIPPPIQQQLGNQVKILTEITNEKEENPTRKIELVKGIKYGIIGGIVSFIIFSTGIFQVWKYDGINFDQPIVKVERNPFYITETKIYGDGAITETKQTQVHNQRDYPEQIGYGGKMDLESLMPYMSGLPYGYGLKQIVIDRKNDLLEKSAYGSLIAFLIFSVIFIIFSSSLNGNESAQETKINEV
jgi:hypothetical protein